LSRKPALNWWNQQKLPAFADSRFTCIDEAPMSNVPEDHVLISKAVSAWYRHYGVGWDDNASSFLCDAAIKLYANDCRSLEMLAATLISDVVGIAATRVNATSSHAVH
jgi:hypothetical protein